MEMVKPSPEPLLTYHQSGSVTLNLGAISQDIPQPSIIMISLKITSLNFHWNLPGTNASVPGRYGLRLNDKIGKYISWQLVKVL